MSTFRGVFDGRTEIHDTPKGPAIVLTGGALGHDTTLKVGIRPESKTAQRALDLIEPLHLIEAANDMKAGAFDINVNYELDFGDAWALFSDGRDDCANFEETYKHPGVRLHFSVRTPGTEDELGLVRTTLVRCEDRIEVVITGTGPVTQTSAERLLEHREVGLSPKELKKEIKAMRSRYAKTVPFAIDDRRLEVLAKTAVRHLAMIYVPEWKDLAVTLAGQPRSHSGISEYFLLSLRERAEVFKDRSYHERGFMHRSGSVVFDEVTGLAHAVLNAQGQHGGGMSSAFWLNTSAVVSIEDDHLFVQRTGTYIWRGDQDVLSTAEQERVDYGLQHLVQQWAQESGLRLPVVMGS